MQITARKHRFPMLNIKYAAVALGIVGALAAGITTYSLTRDDSHPSQPVAAAPVQSSFEQMADENSLGGSPAIAGSTARDYPLPTLREGFQATGDGDNFTGLSPKARGVPSVTTRDDPKAYYNPASGEGLIAGDEGADRSILAPEFRFYDDTVFAEQNWEFGDVLSSRAGAGMLQEEFVDQNPGANRSVQESQRHAPRANGQLTE